MIPIADDKTEEKESGRGRRRGKRSLFNSRQTVLRVLSYAVPFRRQIAAGLLIGMLASLLGSLNLLVLVPALDIMFDSASREERIASQQKDIDVLNERAGNYFENGEWIHGSRLTVERMRREFFLKATVYLIEKKEQAVYILVGGFVIAQILKAFLEFFSKFKLARSFLSATNHMRGELYSHAIALDLSHFQTGTTGDLIGRLNNDIRQVRQVFGSMIGNTAIVPFNVLALFIVLLALNPRLTLITVVAVPLVVLPIGFVGKRLRQMGKSDEAEDVKLIDAMSETLIALPIVKAYDTERWEYNRFTDLARGIVRRQIKRERLRLLSEPAVETLGTLAIGGSIVLGAYLILKSGNAEMTPGQFIAYIITLSRFYPPLKSLSNSYVKAQKALASADRIFEIIDMPPAIVDRQDASIAPPFSNGLEFRSVTFRYGDSRELALRGVDLTIPRGKRVALVGRSGSGKTTIARLLPRFFDPSGGAILFDGMDIRDLTLHSLRSQMAYVAQETHLFNETVLYNIRYGSPEASMQDVVAAAKAANAHDFIQELPDGYNTEIGERGGQLSGGQRQRLAIARAILRNAPILILDEATSALDNESEALVNEALERLMQDRTTLVIAHRLSTVRAADEIIVMHDGIVAERGTHEQLLALNGRYADLCARAELLESTAGVPRTIPELAPEDQDPEDA